MKMRTALPALALLAACGGSSDAATTQDIVVFRGVSVIPMDSERVLEGQTVVVRDGVVAALGPEVDVPSGATVVDGTGKYLIPGLAEFHAHIPTTDDTAAVKRTLFLYLAGGVTTIRGMLGHPSHLELREQAARGEIVSPRIYTSGPSFSGNSAPNPEAAAAMVREQKDAGYDFLKMHPGVSKETYAAIVATANEVGIPFAGHVAADVGLNRALQARQASIDHLDAFVEALAGYADGFTGVSTGTFGFNLSAQADTALIPAIVAATREAGVAVVPTQTLLESLASPITATELAAWPEMRYMPAQTIAGWVRQKENFVTGPAYSPEGAARYLQIRRALISALHDAGVPIVLGSDAPQWWNVPGFSARRELEDMVEAGLSPYEALRTATANAAEYFGAEGEWGTIGVGKSADLILLGANPLQDVSAIWQQEGVMVRGVWLSGEEVARRLEEVAAEVAS